MKKEKPGDEPGFFKLMLPALPHTVRLQLIQVHILHALLAHGQHLVAGLPGLGEIQREGASLEEAVGHIGVLAHKAVVAPLEFGGT